MATTCVKPVQVNDKQYFEVVAEQPVAAGPVGDGQAAAQPVAAVPVGDGQAGGRKSRKSKKGGKRSSKKSKKGSKRSSRRKSRGGNNNQDKDQDQDRHQNQRGGNALAFSDLKSEQHIPLSFDKTMTVAGSIDSGLFPGVQRIHGGSSCGVHHQQGGALEFSEFNAKPMKGGSSVNQPFGGTNYANGANVLASSVGNVLSSLKGGKKSKNQRGGSSLSYSNINGNVSVGSASFGANSLASSSSVANIASSMKGGKKRRGSRGGSSNNQNQRN